MASVTCDQCGKRLRLSPAAAGRAIRCPCGNGLRCPHDFPEDDAAYDLAPAQVTMVRRAPPPTPLAPPLSNVLNYRAPQAEAVTKADPEAIKNLYLPLWLLGGGTAVEIVAALLTERRGMVFALQMVAIQLLVGTTLMLVGILLAVRFRGVRLGGLWTAAYKLAAISVAPAAVAAIFTPVLDHVPLGGVIGWIGEFMLYFALLGVLFDLDESDTWYCVWVIFLVRLAAYFLLWWAMKHWG